MLATLKNIYNNICNSENKPVDSICFYGPVNIECTFIKLPPFHSQTLTNNVSRRCEFSSKAKVYFCCYKVLKALNNHLFISILGKQRLRLAYCCSVKLWAIFEVVFHSVNLIIKIAECKLIDIASDTYA